MSSRSKNPFLRPVGGFSTAQKAAMAAKSQREARAMKVEASRAYHAHNVAMRGLQLSPGEFKSIDENVSAATLDTTGSVTLLNGCARGSDIDEREGREITMKSIQLRGLINANANAAQNQWVRIMIVYDRQTNGAEPAIADIVSPGSLVGMRSLENRKRFKILMDRTITLNANYDGASTVYTASNNHHFIEYYRKLDHPVTFNSGSAGTVSDISTGSLYMVRMGTIASGTGAAAISFTSRVRYQDK